MLDDATIERMAEAAAPFLPECGKPAIRNAMRAAVKAGGLVSGAALRDEREARDQIEAALIATHEVKERAERNLESHKRHEQDLHERIGRDSARIDRAVAKDKQHIRTLERENEALRETLRNILSVGERHTDSATGRRIGDFREALSIADNALAARPQTVDAPGHTDLMVTPESIPDDLSKGDPRVDPDAQPDEADEQPPEQRSEDERWEPDGDFGHDEAHVRVASESLDEATAIAQATGQYPGAADEEPVENEIHEAMKEAGLFRHDARISFTRYKDGIDLQFPSLQIKQFAHAIHRRALLRPRVPESIRALPNNIKDDANRHWAKIAIHGNAREAREYVNGYRCAARKIAEQIEFIIRHAEYSNDE